jgi:hypothetical protein
LKRTFKVAALALLFLILFSGGSAIHYASASSEIDVVDFVSITPSPAYTGNQLTISIVSQNLTGGVYYPLPSKNVTVTWSAPISGYNDKNSTPLNSVITNSAGDGTLSFTPTSPGTYCFGAFIVGDSLNTGQIAYGDTCLNVYDMVYQQQGSSSENITGTVEKSYEGNIVPSPGSSWDQISTLSGFDQTSQKGFASFSWAVSGRMADS